MLYVTLMYSCVKLTLLKLHKNVEGFVPNFGTWFACPNGNLVRAIQIYPGMAHYIKASTPKNFITFPQDFLSAKTR